MAWIKQLTKIPENWQTEYTNLNKFLHFLLLLTIIQPQCLPRTRNNLIEIFSSHQVSFLSFKFPFISLTSLLSVILFRFLTDN